jgi:hypothetical protein
MPEKEFLMPLDDAQNEWMRVRFTTVEGRVLNFAVQYETTIAGQRVPVVRNDNAHGFCHRDIFKLNGTATKQPQEGTPAEVLSQGPQDIRENWQSYRKNFFGVKA